MDVPEDHKTKNIEFQLSYDTGPLAGHLSVRRKLDLADRTEEEK